MTAAEKVTVKFYGGLSLLTVPEGVTEVSADVGTVRDLIKALQFKEHEVGTVLINGTPVLPDTLVKTGDEVALFKPLGCPAPAPGRSGAADQHSPATGRAGGRQDLRSSGSPRTPLATRTGLLP